MLILLSRYLIHIHLVLHSRSPLKISNCNCWHGIRFQLTKVRSYKKSRINFFQPIHRSNNIFLQKDIKFIFKIDAWSSLIFFLSVRNFLTLAHLILGIFINFQIWMCGVKLKGYGNLRPVYKKCFSNISSFLHFRP
jgi:hypothetical protein